MSEHNDNIAQDLSAYLDGQLPPARVAQVEQALAEDPAAAEELCRLRRLREDVGNLPRFRAPDDFVARVMEQAERRRLMHAPAAPAEKAWPWVRRAVLAAAMLLLCGSVGVILHELTTADIRQPPLQRDLAAESVNMDLPAPTGGVLGSLPLAEAILIEIQADDIDGAQEQVELVLAANGAVRGNGEMPMPHRNFYSVARGDEQVQIVAQMPAWQVARFNDDLAWALDAEIEVPDDSRQDGNLSAMFDHASTAAPAARRAPTPLADLDAQSREVRRDAPAEALRPQATPVGPDGGAPPGDGGATMASGEERAQPAAPATAPTVAARSTAPVASAPAPAAPAVAGEPRDVVAREQPAAVDGLAGRPLPSPGEAEAPDRSVAFRGTAQTAETQLRSPTEASPGDAETYRRLEAAGGAEPADTLTTQPRHAGGTAVSDATSGDAQLRGRVAEPAQVAGRSQADSTVAGLQEPGDPRDRQAGLQIHRAAGSGRNARQQQGQRARMILNEQPPQQAAQDQRRAQSMQSIVITLNRRQEAEPQPDQTRSDAAGLPPATQPAGDGQQ